MTLQSSDFTATHNFLVTCDYKAERNETCKSRGVAATSFSPGSPAEPIKSQNPANELLPPDPANDKAPQTDC